MVAVLDASVFRNLLQPFAFESDQIDSQNGIILIGGQFGGGVAQQHVQKLVNVDPRFLHYFSCYSADNISSFI